MSEAYNTCLHHLVQAQARLTPEAVALAYGDRQLSYADLVSRANRYAHYLSELGTGADRRVAVVMERSIEMGIALLAIMTAGGAYLPIDPDDPPERIAHFLDDAGVSVILTQECFAAKLGNFDRTLLCLDTRQPLLDGYPDGPPEDRAGPDDLAYVIYTSGSTGKPKGCMIPHRAICNRLLWMRDHFGITAADRILQKTPYTFDVSVWEFFLPWIAGARQVVAKPGGHRDNAYLIDIITGMGVTVCHFVPSMLSFFLSQPSVGRCDGLRQVFASGEALPFALGQRFQETLPGRLHNLYGPTEAAVDVSYWTWEARPDRAVPIGRPIDNVSLRILDDKLSSVADGETGHLYIGGVALARGYLNHPELTRERFITDPCSDTPGARLYHSGDLARVLPDGNIEYLGRTDHQVKIRGFRIELGEIQSVLERHPQVRQAVIIVHEQNGPDPKIVAFAGRQGQLSEDELRRAAKAALPRHMVPNAIVLLDEIPVTRHGKADLSKLNWLYRPQTADSAPATPASPVFGETEQVVWSICREILGSDRLGADLDLFDQGATSFTMVQILEQISERLAVTLSIDAFLDAPSIRALVREVAARRPAAADASRQARRTGQWDALAAELAGWLAELLDGAEVNLDDDLFDAGATSFTLVQLAERIASRRGPVIDVETMLERPTLRDIADSILNRVALPPETQRIALHRTGFRASAYREAQRADCETGARLKLTTIADLLSLLRRHDNGGEPRYRYASAGGLNPVQTYLIVRESAVAGLPGGAYYHHPVENLLYRLNAGAAPRLEHVLAGTAASVVDGVGFALFFVAELRAIEPVYQGSGGPLAALEAGYMGQLLVSRQESLGVDLLPLPAWNCAPLVQAFELQDSQQIVHCLLGGVRGAWPELHGRDVPDTGQLPAAPPGISDPEPVMALPGSANPAKKVSALRRFDAGHQVITLPDDGMVDPGFFACRAAKRSYRDTPVPFRAFGDFLAMLRCESDIEHSPALFARVAHRPCLDMYLYIRPDAVERVQGGVYRYRPADHSLERISRELPVELRSCHTPFNQKHARAAAFALFMVAPMSTLNRELGAQAGRLALLQSGHVGQLLLERQAEFGIGVCPIGALRFERIRQAFGLDQSAKLVHSFVCGALLQELPDDWRSLIAACSTAPAAARPVPAETSDRDIAITGISWRLPGAPNADAFWRMLIAGADVFRQLPPERARLFEKAGAAVGRDLRHTRGAFLDDIDSFDSRLFGISPVEARTLDPQERLLLETVWHCLEDSGYTARDLSERCGRVGVLAGIMWDDYQHYGGDAGEYPPGQMPVSLHSSAANRISHVFDFTGPSVAVNTSCASALTAMHMARTAILAGECEAAVVGAVNLIGHPYHHAALRNLDLLSSGNCRPFDAEADGWVAGEGAGAVLLRPLKQALRDGDVIHAVIKGSATAYPGQSNRFGRPSARHHAESIRRALDAAGVAADSVSYVETAASGASLADAAEVAAIEEVLGASTDRSPLRIGSVKGNIGHLESASGISQLAKLILQFEHGELAPTVAVKRINPLYRLRDMGIIINEAAVPWKTAAGNDGQAPARRALVNAFGATGSCAHLIIDAPPARPPGAREDGRDHIVLLSAQSVAQLTRLAADLHQALDLPNPPPLADVAWTLATGRQAHAERLALRVGSLPALRQALADFAETEASGPDILRGRIRDTDEASVTSGDSPWQLACAWVEGAQVDWQAVLPAARRVSLPAYPFAKQRHWLDRAHSTGDPIRSLPKPGPARDRPAGTTADLPQAVHYLTGLLAETTGFKADEIESDERFEAYGLTSLMIHRLNARLETDLGPMPKTLFFEYRSVADLSAHLAASFPDRFGGAEDVRRAPLQAARLMQEPAPAPVSPVTPAHRLDVAVVGVAGRYPGAGSVEELWANLRNGVDSITEIPATRWDHAAYFDEDRGKAGKTYAKWGGFLDAHDRFDALFFGITPNDADCMDPQERLFLETVWHTFEDAGYNRDTLLGRVGRRIGVFAGVMYGEYDLHSPGAHGPGNGLAVGSSQGSIANRVSYFFDFCGPSMAVDTLCSSSLTALHLAMNSLRLGECEAAIAGGVNLSIHPNKYLRHAQLGMSSSDGRCRSFGAGGDGFVPGEGVGAVLLKPLERAMADGDQIYGVIRATAINHDGRTNGYTVPNPTAQAEMIRAALDKAGVDAAGIGYVEAHGTGTSLGDPIEIAGLTSAFAQTGAAGPACAIGSVKSNIGHLESAAGIAGLTKILLQLKHKELVPSLHADTLNPNIDFENSPFFVQRQLSPWREAHAGARRACLSSFGAGGSNAHAVIEEYRAVSPGNAVPPPERKAAILVSARTADSLEDSIQALLSFTEAALRDPGSPGANLWDLEYTLQVGREPMRRRRFFLVQSVAELRTVLAEALDAAPREAPQGQAGAELLASLRLDEDFAAMLDAWLAKGRVEPLAQLWENGAAIPWAQLHEGRQRRRISAPLYPFAGQRHWAKTPARVEIPIHSAPAAQPASDATASPAWPTLLFTSGWRDLPEPPAAQGLERHQVLLCGVDALADQLREVAPDLSCAALAGAAPAMPELFLEQARQLLVSLAKAIRTRGKGRTLYQVVVPAAGDGSLSAALSGLLRTAALEDPSLIVQLIAVPAGLDAAGLIARLRHCAKFPGPVQIRYRDDTPLVRVFAETTPPDEHPPPPFRPEGVYLISGGAGGIGRVLAGEISRQTPDARIILCGRREADTKLAAELAGLGDNIEYRRSDVADEQAAAALVESILTAHGRLDGVIHAAGVTRDGFILNKRPEDLDAVLRPKVLGAWHLDQATRQLPLDCFVLFASGSGVTGNPGQGDYACANAFLDQFAEYRAEMVRAGERHGRTLSLDWPYWQDVGMTADGDALAAMHTRLGLTPMPAEAGLNAFRRACALAEHQVVVAHGDAGRMRTSLMLAPAEPAASDTDAPVETPEPAPAANPAVATLAKLKSLVAEITGLPTKELDAGEALEIYGIDSVMIARLNRRLAEPFQALPQTLFFEHQTLAEVGAWLLENHEEACRAWTIAEVPAAETGPQEQACAPPAPAAPAPRSAPAPASTATDEPIAIIGLSGRYPGAEDLDTFWSNLAAGKASISEIPAERWGMSGFYEPDRQSAVASGLSYSKWGGFLSGFAEFDALFFNISPREALSMDPQERLFLEACWSAVEDAGYTRARLADELAGEVGVFAGVTKTGFELYGPELWRGGENTFPRTSFSSLVNRVSYVLDLHGPSVPVDTMCSSSLTAIHEACEHLRRGDCRMAIVGAVNLYLHPSNYSQLCAYNMLSAEGRCHSFGDRADGFVPGEGVGALVLRPLAEAETSGDRILGLILSTSVNHDGKTNGFTVPNPITQASLVRRALDKAGVDARCVSYLEAHGTGTALGDPIEVRSLTTAFADDTADTGFCALGSVKSSIGHLEAAAGLAGLTKVLLQMQHRQLVPSLHAETLNPRIDFAATPFRLQRELSEWPRPLIENRGERQECPRIAGISSFGAGGANAHVLVQEYLDKRPDVRRDGALAIVLSARTAERLAVYTDHLRRFVERHGPDLDLNTLAYTLQTGREAMEQRLALIVRSPHELVEALGAAIEEATQTPGVLRGRAQLSQERIAEISRDPERACSVLKAFQAGDLTPVLSRWIRGEPIAWQALYGDQRPVSGPAPTYPFARERYWFDELPPVMPPVVAESAVPPAARRKRPEWLTLDERWHPAPNDPHGVDWVDRITSADGSSLLLIGGTGDTAEKMRQSCEKIAHITGFEHAFCNVRQLPAVADGEEEAALHKALEDVQRPVIFLTVIAQARNRHELCLEQVLRWTRALLATARQREIRLYVCHEYGAEAPYGEALSGLLRSAMHECPGLHCRCIGMDPEQLTGSDLGSKLVQEWLSDTTAGLEPAQVTPLLLTRGVRHELRVEASAEPAGDGAATGLKRGGSYLVVGGLGAVGCDLCCELGRRHQAELILLSRRSRQAVYAALRRIEGSGARVRHIQADVEDETGLRRALTALRAEGVRLDGVIHMAREVRDGSIVGKTFDQVKQVIGAKVGGTLALDAATADETLDFFLMFSSVAAFGLLGSADYAYSAAFQNAFSRRRNAQARAGLRHGITQAICWGQWTADGGVPADELQGRIEAMRMRGIDTIDAAAALDRIELCLCSKREVVGCVAVTDRARALDTLGLAPSPHAGPDMAGIEARISAFKQGRLDEVSFAAFLKTLPDELLSGPLGKRIVAAIEGASGKSEPQAPEPADEAAGAPETAVRPDAPASAEQQATAGLVQGMQKVLKIRRDQLDFDLAIQSYGLDSVTAVQLSAFLEQKLNRVVPARWLAENPTLNELAATLSAAPTGQAPALGD